MPEFDRPGALERMELSLVHEMLAHLVVIFFLLWLWRLFSLLMVPLIRRGFLNTPLSLHLSEVLLPVEVLQVNVVNQPFV